MQYAKYSGHTASHQKLTLGMRLCVVCVCFFLFVFVTPEGFITMVANEGLDKARAYLNQVPQDQWVYIPSENTF